MAATTMSPQMPVVQDQPAPGQPSSHLFTCNSCQVAFRSSELQRNHMQTDWHRYNLKRKVASLPPLTSEVFTEKVLANQANAAVSAAKATFKKDCAACQKTYYSENAYTNHLASQKHKTLSSKPHARGLRLNDAETSSMVSSTFSLGEPLETASARSQNESVDVPHTNEGDRMEVDAHSTTSHTQVDGEAILSRCLFCNHQSHDLRHNESHMSTQHGMFIPERDYLVDLEGLLTCLHGRIHVLHECLFCGQIKHTATGTQTHMRDRGHCMIPYATEEDMLDVGEFYDFSGTYSDADEGTNKTQDRGVQLGASRTVTTTVDNGNGEQVDADDEGWESDASSLSSVPTEEITAMPIDDHSHLYKTLDKHRHHSHNDPRPHRNMDGYHSHAHPTPHAVYHDEYELHMPSGRVAGHRALKVFYRQNLRPLPNLEDRGRQRLTEGRHDSDDEDYGGSREVGGRADHHRTRQLITRAEGGTGMIGVPENKKRAVRAAEKRTQRGAQRHESDYKAGNERRANFQKHFRDHLLQ